jgi:CheY-like chemotaxis protein
MERKVLIVEDSPADARMLRMALNKRDATINTEILEDGARAIRYFSSYRDDGEIPPCDLILLDLNLPRVSGFEILEFLKADPELMKIPVIVLSGSSSHEDIERSYSAGANSYLCKPTGIDEVFDMTAQLVTYWFEHVRLPGKVSVPAR